MLTQSKLLELLQQQLAPLVDEIHADSDMIVLEVPAINLRQVALQLRDDSRFQFVQLLDICGVDYSRYGIGEWRTTEATASGFSRAVNPNLHERQTQWSKPRFAVVYHLLSLANNCRLRLRVFIEGSQLMVPSVVTIWPVANWYEREAYDLFGIVFDQHPDLRRLLTDYGFKGHPFRKDFPLIGHVELRYDAATKRCVYEPVSIQARVTTPKVIRHDNRYVNDQPQESIEHGRT
jgi:NADH-quinone oxidoreductase subunit C